MKWLVSMLLLPSLAFAGKGFYVAKTGSDSNPGTLAAPFLTINKAINDFVRAGDTLYIRAGEYCEQVIPTHAGTAANPIVVRNYPGETPVINGGMNIDTVWTKVAGTSIYWATFTRHTAPVVRGLTFPVFKMVTGKGAWQVRRAWCWVDSTPDSNHYLRPVDVLTGTEYTRSAIPAGSFATSAGDTSFDSYYSGRHDTIWVRLRDDGDPNTHRVRIGGWKFSFLFPSTWGFNLKADYFQVKGLTMREASEGLYIESSATYPITGVVVDSCDIGIMSGRGMTINSYARRVTVKNSHIHHFSEEGIHIEGDTCYVLNNTIDSTIAPWYHWGSQGVNLCGDSNLVKGNNIFGITKNLRNAGGGAIYGESFNTRAHGTSKRNRVEGNRLHHNVGRGLTLDGSDSTLFINNLIYDNGRGGVDINYNTEADPGVNQECHGNMIYFNTFVRNGGQAAVTMDSYTYNTFIKNNIFYRNYDTVRGGNSTVSDFNVYANPSFVDALAFNFQLQPGSIAIDAGVDVGYRTDFDGYVRPVNKLYDAGAYEYGAGSFALEQNDPNPFKLKTVVGYRLPASSDVRLSVYDIDGREVAVLVNERKAPGIYEVEFDASGLPGGVYLYKLQAGTFVQSRKLLLLR